MTKGENKMLRVTIFLVVSIFICGCQIGQSCKGKIFYITEEKETEIGSYKKIIGLYKMDIDGKNKVKIGELLRNKFGMQIKFSPDGKKAGLSIVNEKKKIVELWLLDIETKEQIKLTDGPHDVNPMWSWDGKRIAFSGMKGKDKTPEIYVVDTNGKNLLQLTNTSLHESSPSWSPDNKKIVFTAEPYKTWISGTSTPIYYQEPENEEDYDSEIYVMNADGTNRIQLTHNLVDDWMPTWSPDGKWIAFVRGGFAYRKGEEESVEGMGLYIMSPDGKNQINVVKKAVFAPCWAPDSKKIIFRMEVEKDDKIRSYWKNSNKEIFIVDIDGKNLKNLTNTPDIDEEYPCWVQTE